MRALSLDHNLTEVTWLEVAELGLWSRLYFSLYCCCLPVHFVVCVCVCVCVCLFRAEPTAYEGFQARGRIEAVAASLHHSHSNSGSKLHMRPTPQLKATLDP